MDGEKKVRITPRELQILMEIAVTGHNHSEVAITLGISPRTVTAHLSNAYRTLGATNLLEAFLALGWITPK